MEKMRVLHSLVIPALIYVKDVSHRKKKKRDNPLKGLGKLIMASLF